MTKTVYILFLFLFFQPLLADSENERIEVWPVDKDLIEIYPNHNGTLIFRVTNMNGPRQSLIGSLQLPVGWKAITQEFPFELDRNQSEIRLVNFFVPSRAPAGQYEVHYRVQGREDPSFSGEFTIRVNVQSIHQINAVVLNIPQRVIAGDTYHIDYLVTNSGNIAESLDIDCGDAQHFEHTIQPRHFSLNPGESKKVRLTYQTLYQMHRSKKHVTTLIVKSKEDQTELSSVTNHIELIPRQLTEINPYYNYPISAMVMLHGSKNASSKTGYQFNLNGSGYLDEGQKHHLEFYLRGPNAFGESILSQYDEYRVSYKNPGFGIHLGDQRFTLSRLTEYSRFGTGAEGYFNYKQFRFGTFFHKSRWMFAASKEVGNYLNWHLNEENKLSLNILHKKSNDQWKNVIGLEGQFHPVKNNRMTVEVAQSHDNQQTDNAFLVDLYGEVKRFRYRLHSIYADPGFRGYYQDTKYLSTNVVVPIIKKLTFEAAYQQNQQNYDLDTTRYSAPFTRQRWIGLRYNKGNGFYAKLENIHRSSRDRLQNRLFDYKESTYRIMMSKNLKQFSISSSGEVGWTQDQITQTESGMLRLTGSVRFTLMDKQQVRAYLYYDKNSRYTFGDDGRFTFGLSCKLSFGKRFLLDLNYRNNSSTEEYYRDRTMVEGLLKYTVARNHFVLLQLRQTMIPQSLYRKDTAVLLQYKALLDVPIGVRKDIGRLAGVLFDKTQQKPVPDVVVHLNGMAVVTNQKGEFTFPALQPNLYFLTIDPSQLSPKQITSLKMPLELKIDGGEIRRVNIDLVTGGTLNGRVVVSKSDMQKDDRLNRTIDSKQVLGGVEEDSLHDGQGLKNIIITLIGEGKTYKRITDKHGAFMFSGLHPGEYTLRGASFNLPEYYRFDQDAYPIQIQAEEEKEQIIEVVPQIRRIRLLQQGGTIIQKEKIDSTAIKPVKKGKITIKKELDLGIQLFRKNNYKDALNLFRNLLKSAGSPVFSADIHYWIGECQYGMNNYKAARESFNRVLNTRASQNLDDTLVKLGHCCLMLGNRDQAKKHFNELARRFPKSEHIDKIKVYLTTPTP